MRASASTEKSQRQALGPRGARKEMRPLETARTTRYKFPNSATSIFGRQKLEKPTFQWATETETVSVPLFSVCVFITAGPITGTREEPGTLTQGAPVGSYRLGIEPKTPGWLVQDPTTRPIGDLIPTIGGGPLKKGEFGQRNRSKTPRGCRGEAANVPKGPRGATLCKFTSYSAGRYDGIPRTCSRLCGKQARANELTTIF